MNKYDSILLNKKTGQCLVGNSNAVDAESITFEKNSEELSFILKFLTSLKVFIVIVVILHLTNLIGLILYIKKNGSNDILIPIFIFIVSSIELFIIYMSKNYKSFYKYKDKVTSKSTKDNVECFKCGSNQSTDSVIIKFKDQNHIDQIVKIGRLLEWKHYISSAIGVEIIIGLGFLLSELIVGIAWGNFISFRVVSVLIVLLSIVLILFWVVVMLLSSISKFQKRSQVLILEAMLQEGLAV